MGREHEADARVIVRSPVRANRSPRREAACVRACALQRSTARPAAGRVVRSIVRRRIRRAAHSAQRCAGSDEVSDAIASRVNEKGRAVVARSFVMER